ncbi:hypothetical protein RFI_21369 [Reticulomyxa filosa]|uniref:Flap endonuclease 1 n=1 Tax=Reticulomyxa filosa TaxID=46433 RepID=X6MRD0_RETFI|nr:hypothetical protein RFI_21369 [Reticulomyxa filosa]|eukprot:ETO15992.1 hypothetical protein RFI_21369 [Reticulomyxa filosa]
MALYQFLVAVRQQGPAGELTNSSGEITSHLVGFFYRTIRMMDNGIKPVWVFDGKPPEFKLEELQKRKENREKAEGEKKKQRRKETPRELSKWKEGVPWVQAPGEAEAQCAKMAQEGIVYGCATEDMDALTFHTPRLVRHLTHTEARKMPIREFNLEKTLQGMDLTYDQFIDLCILCGCDYIPSIRGIGPKTAYKLIKEHGSIEGLLQSISGSKYQLNNKQLTLHETLKVPEGFLFKEARVLFQKPDVLDKEHIHLEWKEPNEEETIKFLVDEKGFNKERVLAGVRRLKASKTKSSQKRLDSFFVAIPSTSSKIVNKNAKDKKASANTPASTIGKKRKQAEGSQAKTSTAKKKKIDPSCQENIAPPVNK